MLDIAAMGALVAGSLIVAIGGQNVFVLRQGLLRNNVFYVSGICFLCDVLLMTAGVMGLGMLVRSSPELMVVLALAGALFLYGYAFHALYHAYQGQARMQVRSAGGDSRSSLKKAVIATLVITLVNPHVYVDTVVVVGGIGGTLTLDEKLWFLCGALAASFVWFFGVGYGARLLSPLFERPRTWRLFNLATGVVMFWIGTGLLAFSIGNPFPEASAGGF